MPESASESTEVLENLARNVVLFRARKGMSQEDLAKESVLSRATISNVERARGAPNVSVVIAIASTLGVKFVDLFAAEEPPAPLSDATIAALVAGRPSAGAVKAQSLLRAIDEAAGHSPERYSRAGRPRATVK
jgi:transcriptional regulator with XRE-family HTH domain